MQRDTYFTFEDIAQTTDVYDPHIVEYFTGTSDAAELAVETPSALQNLRFLRIPDDVRNPSEATGTITCVLTDNGLHQNSPAYVAVSYCWDSFNQTNLGDRISPTLTVSINEKGHVRPPKCSHEVLLRAISFALVRKISLIWIDQECINQEDPIDVQRHLRCMHTIFNQATSVIGLLSFEVADWRQLSIIHTIDTLDEYLHQGSPLENTVLPAFLDIGTVKFMTRLLKTIQMDRWFTRTWVFQERFSSMKVLTLLLRPSAELKKTLIAKGIHGPCSEDIPLNATSAFLLVATWVAVLKKNSAENLEILNSLEALHEAALSLCGYLDGFKIDAVVDAIMRGSSPKDMDSPADGFQCKTIFRNIESCDNRVISDRVAIFANVAEFHSHVNTTGRKSYSLSLLALLLVNNRIPLILVQREKSRDPPYVRDVSYRSLIYHILLLKEIQKEGLGGVDDDLEVLQRFLRDSESINLEHYENAKEFVEDLMEDKIEHRILDSLGKSIDNLGLLPVIPMSVTIGDLLEGITAQASKSRVALLRDHGRKIVRYAVDRGQLPVGSIFLAFYGDWCWRSYFVDQYFGK